MLSKAMHSVLSCLPSNHEAISYGNLVKKCTLTKDELNECFLEVDFQSNPYYRRSPNTSWQNSDFYISEIGLAEVEAYEQGLKNQKATDDALKVAKIAMWVAIASAIAAVASLVKMFF